MLKEKTKNKTFAVPQQNDDIKHKLILFTIISPCCHDAVWSPENNKCYNMNNRHSQRLCIKSE